jgi:hypothetical protein
MSLALFYFLQPSNHRIIVFLKIVSIQDGTQKIGFGYKIQQSNIILHNLTPLLAEFHTAPVTPSVTISVPKAPAATTMNHVLVFLKKD